MLKVQRGKIADFTVGGGCVWIWGWWEGRWTLEVIFYVFYQGLNVEWVLEIKVMNKTSEWARDGESLTWNQRKLIGYISLLFRSIYVCRLQVSQIKCQVYVTTVEVVQHLRCQYLGIRFIPNADISTFFPSSFDQILYLSHRRNLRSERLGVRFRIGLS